MLKHFVVVWELNSVVLEHYGDPNDPSLITVKFKSPFLKTTVGILVTDHLSWTASIAVAHIARCQVPIALPPVSLSHFIMPPFLSFVFLVWVFFVFLVWVPVCIFCIVNVFLQVKVA